MNDDIGTSSHYDRVRQFHEKAGATINKTPTMPPAEDRLLRAKLIMEEALETVEALGLSPLVRLSSNGEHFADVVIEDMEFKADREPDLVEIADGCADIMVVTTGTLISMGIPDIELQRIVDENNLAKFGPGGHRRADGKWIKPPNHQPPDIERVLREQGWEGQR